MPRLRIFGKQAHLLSTLLSSSIQTWSEQLRAKMSSLLNFAFESGHWKGRRLLHRQLLHLPSILQNINIFNWINPVPHSLHPSRKSETKAPASKLPFNMQFLFPFSIILFTLLHCLLMLLSTRPDCLVTHQIFPREIWPQADIIFSIGGSMSLLIYSCLLFRQDRTANDLNCDSDRPKLKSAVSRKMFAFRRRARLAIRLMLLQLILYAELYFTYQMLVVHRLPPRLVLLLTLYFPFYTAYCIFSNIGYLACFLVVSQCLQIRQAELLLRPTKAALARTHKQAGFSAMSRLWRQFGALNQQAISLNRELRTVNHFWGLYVTVYFVGYVLLICYMAYCFLFSRSSFFARSLFTFLGGNNFLLLCLVIYQCTGLLRQNRAFQRLNLQLCRYFQNTFVGSKQKNRECAFKLTECSLIKTQSIVSSQYVNVGFCLNNGHLINSNTYIQTFHAMSTYFMLTFIGKI